MTVTERECKLKELQALDFKLYDKIFDFILIFIDIHRLYYIFPP